MQGNGLTSSFSAARQLLHHSCSFTRSESRVANMSHHSHFDHMRFVLSCFVAVSVGCTPPLAVGERAASDDVQTPLCTFDVRAPESLAGSLTHPQTGLDCVPPEYGDRFTIGFGHDDWRVIVGVPRASSRVGDTIALDGRRATMLYQSTHASCTEWTGSIVWTSDLPSWRARVDATCADGSVRIDGQWSRD
jgi:hypothetical protein